MPRINGSWGSNKELIFNFPAITDPKYSGYKVSSNICNISNTEREYSYVTTTLYTKNESGVLAQRMYSYRSTINCYKDFFLKDSNDKGVDMGIYLNKKYPYAQLVLKPESCTITTDTIPYVDYELVYAVPTITNFSINRKYSTAQLYVNFTVNACDSYSIEVNGHTVNNSRILEESFLNKGLNTINITCVNGDKTNTTGFTYTLEETQPILNDFTVESANGYVDEPVEISFNATTYNRFAVFNNGKQIATGTGNSMVLPKSKLVIGTNKLHVVVYKDLSDSKYGSYVKSATSSVVNKTLKTYMPTVTNVVLENNGNLIDNNSVLTWQSTHQSVANIYINDKFYKSTTGNELVITKGSFKEGQNKVKVEVIKNGIDGVENSEVAAHITTTYTMSRIKPTISGLKVDKTNIDEVITITWTSTNQSTFALFQDERLICTGQDTKRIVLSEGTLSPVNSKLRLVVTYDSGFDTTSVEEEIEFNGTQNTPIIYGLEPSNISMNIDEVVTVTFSTNEFCDRWELVAGGSTVRGTSGRAVALPKNSFSKGRNTVRLTTYYSPSYNALEVRTATKTVEFTGYGKPKAVELEEKTVYTTATPTITWKKDSEQVAFECIVKDSEGLTVQSKSVISADNSLKLDVLENHSQYTVSVRIKNTYDLWSEYATNTFETNFNEIPQPTIELFPREGSVLIVAKSHQEDTFNGVAIFRRTDNTEWERITDQKFNSDDSILDNTALGKVYYKARVYDTLGGYADSEVKSVEVAVQNYHLANVQDLSQEIQLDFVKPNYGVVTEVVTKKFAGNSKPRVFKSNTNYNQGSLTITLENKELLSFMDFIEQGQIFCYRDRRSKKMFCFVNIENYSPINAFFMEVTVNLTEVNFVETGLYKGKGWRKIVYLNGSYYLDGAIDLSGFVENDLLSAREERI